MISLSTFWYYHDTLILSWYIKISSPSTLSHIQANIWYDDIGFDILTLSWYIKISSPSTLSHIQANIWYYDMGFDILILLWYTDIIMIYQAPPHLVTSRPTFDMMIWVSTFWYYHDTLILSWYIKISSPSTLSHIQANIWYYDMGFDILILLWYTDIIMTYQNIKPLHT